ncbi:MAG: hypothetical protein ACYC91_17920 [Solirubrobacteraceae bacterium]
MSALANPATPASLRQPGPIGHRVELARYTIPIGERILYGQRVNGVVRVSDSPARGQGRAYLVERGLEQDGNAALQALLADYLLCRRRHGRYYADPFSMPIVDGEVLHLPRS